MPEYLPQYARDYNENQIKDNITKKLSKSNKMVQHIKMSLRCRKRLQLGSIRHYKYYKCSRK